MKAVMKLLQTEVFQLKDIQPFGMVRLTKWLPLIKDEIEYLEKEYARISTDTTRFCYIVYHCGKIALYVNDVTNGSFEKLSEEDDDEAEETVEK